MTGKEGWVVEVSSKDGWKAVPPQVMDDLRAALEAKEQLLRARDTEVGLGHLASLLGRLDSIDRALS